MLKTYLGSSIARTSTCSFKCLPRLIHVTEPEIDHLQLAVKVNQEVLWLQIAMADTQFVDVVHTSYQLLEVLGSSLLFQLLILDNHVKELASAGELHDQVQVFLCLDDFINLNYIGMVKLLQNLDFPANPFYVLLIFNLRLFKHFHSNLNSTTKVNKSQKSGEMARKI